MGDLPWGLLFVGREWDVIYVPWNSAAIAYYNLFYWGIPVVVSCRGSQINVAPHNPRRHDIVLGLRRTFARAAAVHCVCEAILHAATAYGLDPGKATIIRPAVDPDFFAPSEGKPGLHPDRLKVITTGSLIWHKGLEYALLTIRRLRDAAVPAQLEILGDGPERQRVVFTIHDLGLERHVQLLGRQPPEVVRDRLREADVFLLSSVSEGISNAVLEAMSCGLPVVTTDCGGMREAVNDGQEGRLVAPRDAAASAAALQELWRNPQRLAEMGQAGRRRVVAEFNLNRQLQQWVDLLVHLGLRRCA